MIEPAQLITLTAVATRNLNKNNESVAPIAQKVGCDYILTSDFLPVFCIICLFFIFVFIYMGKRGIFDLREMP